MIGLRIDFLKGSYHAADPTNPTRPEWPPAPDRVFQTLVAAAASIGAPLDPLRALEHAPEIAFGEAKAVIESTVFVPAAFTTPKGNASAVRGNVAKADPMMVGIAEPVCYVWQAPPELAAWLRPVAAAVTHLGRAKSPVLASVIDTLPLLPNRRVPSAAGDELLRIPTAGRLDVLEAAFQARVRAPVAMMVAYADPQEVIAPSPWGELLALRTTGEVLAREAAQFAEATRAAVLALAGDAAPRALHGHVAAPHVAWGVFSDVGHGHAEGRVLGVGVWLPASIGDADRTACALPLMQLDHVMFGNRRIGVYRVAESALPRGLTPAAWTRPARSWATVTPLVLDRNPKGGQTVESAVADSVEMAGYPRPIAVEAGQHSALKGVPAARAFQPRRPGRWVHAVVTFDRPVRGPVIVGRERYFGLGLLRAIDERRPSNARAAA